MWKGPLVDGVTQSLLNQFLECPYCFYLYAILGLTEEEPLHPNLIWGDCYHKGLELLIPSRDFHVACEGMIKYLHTTYPEAPSSYPITLRKLLHPYKLSPFEGDWTTEEVIDKYIDIRGHLVRIRGKKDAITRNHPDYGKVLGEHKAKGYIDPLKTKEELLCDTQCNLYLHAEENCEWVFYDLIKIPEAQKYGPARKAGEDEKAYWDRIFRGPCGSYKGNYPILLNTHNWIHQGVHFISLEQQAEVFSKTIAPLILRLIEWYDYVTQPDFDHNDPKYFNEIFYIHPVRHFQPRSTGSFNCRYHSLLTKQITEEDLVPVKSYYAELEEEEK